ncbi:MAG: hypothetical protein QM820_19585 [Minicystis sp.]
MSDPRLDELWHEVLNAWNDDAAHAAFLDHCRATKQLGAGAARYREELRKASAYREDQTRVETAQKRLNAIAMLAMLDLDASKTAPDTARLQLTGTVLRWVAGLIFLAIAVFTVLRFVTK